MNKSIVKTVPQILKDNICTIFNLLNVLIALSLAAVGAWKNILFIFVIIINTAVGIIQEIKAKRRIEQLTLLSMPQVTVQRNGQKISIMPEEVKKGDILYLESGSVVCSDCTIEDGTLEIDESILTGEGEPVSRSTGDKLLSGSTVISVKCVAEVICEPEESFTSKIMDEVRSEKQNGSELITSMKKVTHFTSFFIIPLGILLFIQGYFFRGMSAEHTVVSASAGLLGMLPKGLVLLISVGLAVGVIRLSKKNVLVRELYSLENLARCDTVCLDKTGTLTEGKLTVEEVFSDIDEHELEKLMSTYLKYTDDNNSTYIALKNHFKTGETYGCTASAPFSSERKYSAVTLDNGQTFVIGAPEKLCKNIPYEVSEIMSEGRRVIFAGLCRGEICPENTELAGMIVISDKIRKNAPKAMRYFYSQDIDVRVISGDNACAAAAAAEKAGVIDADLYVDMSEVADECIENVANQYVVFGRVTPKQKKLLVAALQKSGKTVAMTGDGVNDLPAIRKADCSVAMGNGSDAAKQTAQLVLLDSDFSVLKEAISEGRRVINNLTKSAGVFFIKTIYSVLLCIWCLLLNMDFPFIPIQITLIDAAIEAFPALFMSFERNDVKADKSFLKTAVRAAFPNAALIFVCCGAILAAVKIFGFNVSNAVLVMYLAVGFISLEGVIKASLPFNMLRGFLTLASACGFIGAVTIFSGLLQLPQISIAKAVILAVGFAVGLVLAAGAETQKRRKYIKERIN